MEENCKHCGMPPRKECVNSHIILDDFHCTECPNMKLLRTASLIRNRMTPEMLEVKHVPSSPLYVPRKYSEAAPSVNLIKKNLFIKGISRAELLGHLKLILLCQNLKYKIVDDGFLVDVYLSKHAYDKRPKEDREVRKTYNSVDDLIGEEFDLVVILLGIQSHKNAASAHVLLEALKRRREIYSKATWILEPSGAVWSLSKDDAVESYIIEHFSGISIKPHGVPDDDLVQYDEPEAFEAPVAPKQVVRRAPSPIPVVEEPSVADDGFEGLGVWAASKKKTSYKRRG